MSNARDLRPAKEAGARVGTSAAGIAPGKRTLVETLPGVSPALSETDLRMPWMM